MATPKLKLGNDKWATKQRSLLAFNDEGNNFKSLPFQVERLSGGSYVGRNGLIQYAATEEPRIDFTNYSKGALLLEPQRTNKQIYSQELNNSAYSKVNITVTADQTTAPDGTETADKVQRTSTSASYIQENIYESTNAYYYSASFFVKKGNCDRVAFRLQTNYPDRYEVRFVFSTESVEYDATLGDMTNGSYNIVKYSNGWYRVEITAKTASDNTAVVPILSPRVSAGNVDSTDTSSTAFCYSWGWQTETSGNTGSGYATSYIPTAGSASSRIKDEVINGGNEYIFNDTEGVLFLDVEIPNNSSEVKQTSLNNGTTSEAVKILQLNGTTFRFEVVMSSGTNFSQDITVSPYQRNKLALQYKANEYKVFVNGTKQTVTQRSTLPTGLYRFNFNRGFSTSDDFIGSINELKIFNTAQTDAELQTLTTL